MSDGIGNRWIAHKHEGKGVLCFEVTIFQSILIEGVHCISCAKYWPACYVGTYTTQRHVHH